MERRDNKNRVKQTLWISPEHSKAIKELDAAFPETAGEPLSDRIARYNFYLLWYVNNTNNND